MPDFTSALKEEIRRLARREAKRCAVALKLAVTRHRSEMIEMKRQIAELSRMVLSVRALAAADGAATLRLVGGVPSHDGHDPRRFSAKGLRSHRKRLNLSADQYGLLIGVSAQSVYAYESGRAKPRAKPLVAIAELRAMGKRDIFARLAQIEAAQRPSGGDGRA